MKISKFLKERLVAALTSDVAAEELNKVISAVPAGAGNEVVSLKILDAVEVIYTDSVAGPVLFKNSQTNPNYDEATGTFTVSESGTYLINALLCLFNSSPGAANFRVELHVNQVPVLFKQGSVIQSINSKSEDLTHLISLNSGDLLQINVTPFMADIATLDGPRNNSLSIIKIS